MYGLPPVARLGEAPDLRWIQLISAGVPPELCSAAQARNITVTNLATGATVTVVINDRGPFGGRFIDLSEYAFSRIAPLGQGVCIVRITW